jgi:hypothetical protein
MVPRLDISRLRERVVYAEPAKKDADKAVNRTGQHAGQAAQRISCGRD